MSGLGNLKELRLNSCGLTGSIRIPYLRSSHQNQNSHLHFPGPVPDFSANVNLEYLRLNQNKLEGEFQLEVQPSDSELNFAFFRTSARF